ncbi:1-propanol dehydrogenase PduQ [Lachnotalea glycerini]|uniref:Iron-containing alcohol dehydrogenase n=1 Tax=Lachnotalea glycerini TaxID=1763509 RepID=A0A371JIK5_9FIRM|nr:1-propanol dehydrogenase PduQ [Lachnotalea glycerini]RDY32554.1 iron-containing alcohol dehydrogenase [Lachnotalea glycerini]
MSNFSIATKIIIGSEDSKDVFAGMTKVMIITDNFMKESGKVSYVTELLEEFQIQYEIFSDVRPDPDIESVTKGVLILEELKPQAVVAFGGGSAIDAAKAVVYFASRNNQSTRCTFVAIPTTSGTGTEVTKFSIISDPAKKAKYPLVDDKLIPDYCILDAELIKSVPPSVTADTGVDVFTHAIEAIVSSKANDFSDAAAEKAIKLFRDNLLKAFKKPDDMQARKGMHNASTLAGIAFSNAGLGLNHGIAHTLGAHFHIPHGRANAIILPYVITFNAGLYDTINETAKRYQIIAELLNVDSTMPRQSCLNLVRFVNGYIKKLNLPSTIQEAGIDEKSFMDNLDEMVKAALADRCTATNPRECTYDEVHRLFQTAYYGKVR